MGYRLNNAWSGAVAALGLLVAATVMAADGAPPTLVESPEGVMIGKDLVSGASLLRRYEFHQPATGAAVAGQDRERNRATVQRFFQLPIGQERAALYADSGVKQIPAMGVQWSGLEAHRRNNAQNATLFPGWAWQRVTVWDTPDPTVFWVEADGSTAPGRTPAWASHYVCQFVVRDGKIALFREFGVPVKLTP